MSAKGPKQSDDYERRSTALSFPKAVWRELERRARENYRPVNAEIAMLVVDSLPSDNDRN